MTSNFMIKLALTTAFVAVPTIGCTSLGISSTLSVNKASASAKKAHAWALKAEKAVAKGHLDKAVMFSEAAVQEDFQNRDYRAQLAQIYMSQGRFLSAEQTWMDVMELGQVDPRTVISLALSRIALGKVESAVALVEANLSLVPASDYGLTLALAGQSGRAVNILSEAIRADNATARTRQNLALAFALDGRWREARSMAVQDMNQDVVNERIAEWAQYARPGAYEMRVAGLLKVTPQSDSGQPVRLALANATSSLATNSVAAPESPIAFERQKSALSAIGPVPTAESNGFAAARESVMDVVSVMTSAPVPPVENQIAANSTMSGGIRMVSIPVLGEIIPDRKAPLIFAQKGPTKTAGVAARQKAVEAPSARSNDTKAVKLAMADVVPHVEKTSGVKGTHLVQLGAFSSVESAKKAWEQFNNRYTVLSGFSSASSSTVVNGKSYVRLAAMGFDSKQSADALCNSIKAKGGSCLVRNVSGKQPVKLAAATGRRIAAR
jgi:D-alanyl-D-alanine carboxypeptidase